MSDDAWTKISAWVWLSMSARIPCVLTLRIPYVLKLRIPYVLTLEYLMFWRLEYLVFWSLEYLIFWRLACEVARVWVDLSTFLKMDWQMAVARMEFKIGLALWRRWATLDRAECSANWRAKTDRLLYIRRRRRSLSAIALRYLFCVFVIFLICSIPPVCWRIIIFFCHWDPDTR